MFTRMRMQPLMSDVATLVAKGPLLDFYFIIYGSFGKKEEIWGCKREFGEEILCV